MKIHPLGALSVESFLTEYWQKKPLLVRQAFPGIQPPVSAEELAGLACEDMVESRLVVQGNVGARWELMHGPFSEETFQRLPKTHWTLMVQAVDHWVPEAAEFLDHFSFIPNWRIDDVMISYAGDKGGVGPHFDNYDVFLVQASGRRRWEIGGLCNEHSPRRPDTPVMILSEWEPDQSWVLEPGDMLYVPPGIAHNGIAVGDDCMTCSVGFRAPSHRDMLLAFANDIGELLSEERRYADPDLVPQANPGLMTSEALEKVHGIFSTYVDNPALLAEWFGRYMTEAKYGKEEMETETEAYRLEDIRTRLSMGGILKRNEGSRFAFQEQGGEFRLFVDGRCYPCSESQGDLVKQLCAVRMIDPVKYLHDENHVALLADLLSHGSLYSPE